jgi:hypothetical protein
VPTIVASLDDVIASKEGAGRDKDFEALPTLIELRKQTHTGIRSFKRCAGCQAFCGAEWPPHRPVIECGKTFSQTSWWRRQARTRHWMSSSLAWMMLRGWRFHTRGCRDGQALRSRRSSSKLASALPKSRNPGI